MLSTNGVSFRQSRRRRTAGRPRLAGAGRSHTAGRGATIMAGAALALAGASFLPNDGAAYAMPAPAVEARLIGECDGRILAALEEDSFPYGCAWIEPIRVESDS